MPIPPVVLAGPRAVLGLAGSVHRGAVSNARAASAAVAQQVVERRVLAPAPGTGPQPPGVLSRLGTQECLALLGTRTVGRLAYIARAGVPDIVPVNYTVVGADVIVRSGAGPKLQAAERREVVAFEVDDLDDATRTGWSVVAVGRAERLTAAQISALPVESLPTTWAEGPRWSVLRLRRPRLDGRRLH